MKKILLPYAGYNVWANQQVTDCILTLSEEQLHREIICSFTSIHKTLLHMWDAESMWWQRMKLLEIVERPSDKFSGSTQDLVNNLMQQSRMWKEWIEAATEAALEHEFIYKNTKKEQFKQPIAEAVHHLFNHATYHRGQLITLFRQVGVIAIPNTDLINFYRRKSSKAANGNRETAMAGK